MAKVVEAKLVVDAEDRTGGVLDAIGKKLAGMGSAIKQLGGGPGGLGAKTVDAAKGYDRVATAVQKAEYAVRNLSKTQINDAALGKSFQKNLDALKLTQKQVEQVEASFKRLQSSAPDTRAIQQWARETIRNLKAVQKAEHDTERPVGSRFGARSGHERGHPRELGYLGEAADHYARRGATLLAAERLAHGAKHALGEGAERQHTRVQLQQAGIGADEIKHAEEESLRIAKVTPRLNPSEIMEIFKETRSAVQHPEEAFHVLETIAKMSSLMKAGNIEGKVSDIVKAGETLGLMNDPHRFAQFAEASMKAMQVMGKTISPEQIYEAAKYTKSAGATLSDRFLGTVMPSLTQELHGSSAGEAISGMSRGFRSGLQNKHLSVEMMDNLGLLEDRSKIRRSKTGSIKGYSGRIVGQDLLATDPDKYVYDVLKPAMVKKGITKLDDQISYAEKILPKVAANLVRLFLQQEETFKAHAKNYDAAPGLDQAIKNQAADPKAGAASLTTAVDNLLGTLTSPIMSSAGKALTGFSERLAAMSESLSEMQKDSPVAAAAVTGGAAVGAVGAGYLGLKTLSAMTQRFLGTAPKAPLFPYLKGLGGLLNLVTPFGALGAMAGSTTPDEDHRLAAAADHTKDIRQDYGDDVLAKARREHQPWYRKSFSLDSSDEHDVEYIEKYFREQSAASQRKFAEDHEGHTGRGRMGGPNATPAPAEPPPVVGLDGAPVWPLPSPASPPPAPRVSASASVPAAPAPLIGIDGAPVYAPAAPAGPVDVTGKVQLEGKAEVNVTVKVEGEARVTGMSATSSGNIKTNVGASMPHMGHN